MTFVDILIEHPAETVFYAVMAWLAAPFLISMSDAAGDAASFVVMCLVTPILFPFVAFAVLWREAGYEYAAGYFLAESRRR